MRAWGEFIRDSMMDDPRTVVRLALGAGIWAGLLTAVFFAFLRPDPNVSFDIYYHTARTALEGDIAFDTPSGSFVYPPVVAVWFFPFVLVGDLPLAFALYRALNLVLSLGIGLASADFIDEHAGGLNPIDRGLVVVFFVATVYPITILIMGQVEIVLATGLVLGFIALESDREPLAGVAFAVPAVIKVFPSLWGLWFVRERAWRAVAAATATGLGSIALGVAVFGVETHLRYLRFVRETRIRIDDFATTVSPEREFLSLMRPLSAILSDVDPHYYPFVALLLVAPPVLLLYRRVDTIEGRTIAFLATVVGIILVLPTSQDLNAYQVYFPAIASMYLVDDDRVRTLLAAGLVVTSFNFDPAEVDAVLTVLAPATVHEMVLSLVTPVLTFASMPLYGLVLLFSGCVVYAVSLDR